MGEEARETVLRYEDLIKREQGGWVEEEARETVLRYEDLIKREQGGGGGEGDRLEV